MEISVEELLVESRVFKTQNPVKHCQEWERNERRCFRTKQNNNKKKKQVRVVSTMCLRTIALSQNLLDSVGNAVV